MKIEWEQRVRVAESAPLSLVAACCQAAEGVALPLAAHVVVTDDAEIRALNARTRGVDRATDVLSFPTVNYPAGKTARGCEKRLRAEYDPELGACLLGDIVISYPRALEQAAEYGHSARRELCYLLAHGLFHLMGYDHMDPDEQKEMRAMEEKALGMAGIARGEGPASVTDAELLALARLAMENSYWRAALFGPRPRGAFKTLNTPTTHTAVGGGVPPPHGRVFQGCNIENASFGLTNCAERTALFKAVSEGARDFTAIAIASNGSAPYPCGACRQALNEFAPGLRVLVTWGEGEVDETTLPALLPHGFGPRDLPD